MPATFESHADVTTRVSSRDTLRFRISAMSQATMLLALGSTGLVAGFLAQAAQAKDRAAANVAGPDAAQEPVSSPAPRSVAKPLRTVHVRAKAPVVARPAAAPAAPRATGIAPRSKPAPRRAVPPAPRVPAPKPATKPAATTSSGS